MIARSAQRTPTAGVRPVGFLDDDPRLVGRPWPASGSTAASRRSSRRSKRPVPRRSSSPPPTPPGRSCGEIVDAATAQNLTVRTVPSMVELLDGSVDAYRVRPVRVEDLLRRPTATEHVPEVDDVFRGPHRAHHRRRWLDRFRARPTGPGRGPEAAHPAATAPRAPCSISIASCRRSHGDTRSRSCQRLGNVVQPERHRAPDRG